MMNKFHVVCLVNTVFLVLFVGVFLLIGSFSTKHPGLHLGFCRRVNTTGEGIGFKCRWYLSENKNTVAVAKEILQENYEMIAFQNGTRTLLLTKYGDTKKLDPNLLANDPTRFDGSIFYVSLDSKGIPSSFRLSDPWKDTVTPTSDIVREDYPIVGFVSGSNLALYENSPKALLISLEYVLDFVNRVLAHYS